ncbi:ABC transporter permease [Baekduia soli]|nr:ABC transporter permease [Baekduia soli]
MGVLASRYGLLVAFLVTILVFSLARPHSFPTWRNTQSILTLAAPSLIMAVGLTVVLVMQDFDLSIGAMIGLGSGAAMDFMVKNGIGTVPMILIVLAIAIGAGLLNGYMVAFLGGSSFIITLAMGTVLTGVEYAMTNQDTVYSGFSSSFTAIGQNNFLGLNLQIWIALVIGIIIWVLLDRSEIGRYMYAIGGNSEAARLSGVRVRILRVLGFVIVAITAAIVGLLLTAQAGSYAPNVGGSYLLPAFAAVFLGAAVFRPGEFNVLGTLVGVLFLGVIQTGLTMLDLQTYLINLVQGGILITAVLVSRLGQRQA